ncbi:hypothetical protein HDU67_002673, partial [Dinochytrium kinnereticum]
VLNEREVLWAAQGVAGGGILEVRVGGFRGQNGYLIILESTRALRVAFFGTSSQPLKVIPAPRFSTPTTRRSKQNPTDVIPDEPVLFTDTDDTTASNEADVSVNGMGVVVGMVRTEVKGPNGRVSVGISAADPLVFLPSVVRGCDEDTRNARIDAKLISVPGRLPVLRTAMMACVVEKGDGVSCQTRIAPLESLRRLEPTAMVGTFPFKVCVVAIGSAMPVKELFEGLINIKDVADKRIRTIGGEAVAFKSYGGRVFAVRKRDEFMLEVSAGRCDDLVLPVGDFVEKLNGFRLEYKFEDDFPFSLLPEKFSECCKGA